MEILGFVFFWIWVSQSEGMDEGANLCGELNHECVQVHSPAMVPKFACLCPRSVKPGRHPADPRFLPKPISIYAPTFDTTSPHCSSCWAHFAFASAGEAVEEVYCVHHHDPAAAVAVMTQCLVWDLFGRWPWKFEFGFNLRASKLKMAGWLVDCEPHMMDNNINGNQNHQSTWASIHLCMHAA